MAGGEALLGKVAAITTAEQALRKIGQFHYQETKGSKASFSVSENPKRQTAADLV